MFFLMWLLFLIEKRIELVYVMDFKYNYWSVILIRWKYEILNDSLGEL